MTLPEPAFPPIIITFEWDHDGKTLKTIVDDGETREPWYLTSSTTLNAIYPELRTAYMRIAAVGAIRNWREQRGS